MKNLFVFLLLLIASCSAQQTFDSPNQVANAFIEYKNLPLTLGEEFQVIEHQATGEKIVSGGDFVESSYFISYWSSPECVEGYTVFENCSGARCRYKFEWVEGVCD
ncbi:hypothetical protein SAMN02745866_01475 [Alteromonadaceae bacterium Bs31]|nr:hypothetical protein SAMN02745866_01475 [Alteromonadaceae bacterium Bs31]